MPSITIPRPGQGSEYKGYVAVPSGDGPWPGVVVLHELFGLNKDIRYQTDHLAANGYLAVAPDLFSDGGARRCLISTFRSLFKGSGKAIDDIDAARTYLAGRPDCTGHVGVVGFCLGGGFALLTAKTGFEAAAPNYGPLPRDLDKALQGSCPIVGNYGGADFGLRGATEKLDDSLTRLGVEHDIKEHPGAGHSFMSLDPPGPAGRLKRVAFLGHDQAATDDSWARIFAFFGEHLAESSAG
jgi:carboxymethylenebutenolidase